MGAYIMTDFCACYRTNVFDLGSIYLSIKFISKINIRASGK